MDNLGIIGRRLMDNWGKIHGCLEIPDLFRVLNMISHE